ncbi:MAG: hypothetical protein R2854_24570 [Caldilineaceae bacterium]
MINLAGARLLLRGMTTIYVAMKRQRPISLPSMPQKGEASEFAIGTGRIALPLLEKGVHVDGISVAANG